MHASILVLGAMLGSASHALASSHRVLPLHVNHAKRQGPGNAFDPPETDICDPTWPICGNTNFCFNEAEDYKCCPGEERECPRLSTTSVYTRHAALKRAGEVIRSAT
jgi:hypothetical protein